jgi:hypothetical protein
VTLGAHRPAQAPRRQAAAALGPLFVGGRGAEQVDAEAERTRHEISLCVGDLTSSAI